MHFIGSLILNEMHLFFFDKKMHKYNNGDSKSVRACILKTSIVCTHFCHINASAFKHFN